MPERNPDDTDRMNREDVRKAAEQEAEQARFEAAGDTLERPCLTSYQLKPRSDAKPPR